MEPHLLSGEVLFWSLLSLGVASAFVSLYFVFGDHTHIPSFSVLVPEPCSPGWHGEVLAQPSLKVSGSSAIQCYNPANGESLGIFNPVTPDGIDRAASRAVEAQVEWMTTTWSQRRRWLQTLKRHILDNQETIVTAACADSGKTRVDAYFGEILVTLEKIDWLIKHGEQSLKPEKRPTNLLMCYKTNEVRWEPMGVVAACVSWNYPFHNLLSPILSSLFAGNAIILKPSERTAWSSAYFIAIAKESLVACGHSAQLIQSCVCWPSTAPYLVSHPAIAHLTFIGSREVAHEVAKAATHNLVPLCLELGGKDPAIVLDDVATNNTELDRVVAILVRGVFQAAGQNCIGIERIIAQPCVYPRLVTKLQDIVQHLQCGDCHDASNQMGVDVGAMITDARFDLLEELIQEAAQEGARLLIGGHRVRPSANSHGHYFAPTLIVDVRPSMRIAQTELFAPIMMLMPTESALVEVAIHLANSSAYALGASVFGSHTESVDAIVNGVKSGMVAVNDFAAFYAVQLPFGGVKGSGYGRFAGKEGLRSICNMKSVCRDRLPWLAKTAIPQPLQIPYGGLDLAANERSQAAGQKAEKIVRGVVELGYGDTLTRRVLGLRKIIGL